MLDYKLIEALAAVIREGGFDKASRVLFLTQSAVSQRVRLLEEQTGQVLLVRESPPRATPAGQKMIKHYLQVKRLEDDLLDFLVPAERGAFAAMAVGINADSLATWFMDAVRDFLKQERVVLDLRADDQEQTHRFIRDGEVLGCVSSHDRPIQGCRMDYLGRMDYHMVASPDFAAKWFPEGVTSEAVHHAPALLFNRKDHLHTKIFLNLLGMAPASIPAHYLPSSGKFAEFIASGLGYGMLPEQQCGELLDSGVLVDLVPSCHVPVRLFWHCWNIRSRLLGKFSETLINQARKLLKT